MPELSQLVRQRLAAREKAGVHPDPDTLTAYSEQLLPVSEREQVLEHLAACGQCREVIALSLPQPVESLPEPEVAVPRRGWRWKPALALAASLASLAIVATLIIELPQKPTTFQSAKQSTAPAADRPAEDARLQPGPGSSDLKALPSATTTNGPLADSKTHASGAGAGAGNVVLPRREAAPPPSAEARTATAAVPSASVAGAVVSARKPVRRDYVNEQMFANDVAEAEAEAPAAAVPAAPLPRSVAEFPASSLTANTGTLNTRTLTSNTPLPAFADLPAQTQGARTVRSKQPANASNRFGIIPNLPALGRKAEALAKRALPIAPGSLTFSTMSGRQLNPAKSGEQVEPAAAAPQVANGGNAADLDQSRAFTQKALASDAYSYAAKEKDKEASAGTMAWKVADGKLLKSSDSASWLEGYAGESISFSVVAAHGSSIWAGGDNAALIHSSDDGATWQRITLGASATGTITTITTASANVHVKSSSGQSWSSQDGGQSWTLDN